MQYDKQVSGMEPVEIMRLDEQRDKRTETLVMVHQEPTSGLMTRDQMGEPVTFPEGPVVTTPACPVEDLTLVERLNERLRRARRGERRLKRILLRKQDGSVNQAKAHDALERVQRRIGGLRHHLAVEQARGGDRTAAR
jgi:hypothetical protein